MCAQCRLIVLDTANSYTGKFDNLYNKMSPQKNAYYSIFLLDNYYQPLVLEKIEKWNSTIAKIFSGQYMLINNDKQFNQLSSTIKSS